MAPFFSIIIPCYNSAQYIDATLQSLSEQTYKQFEVIVIDDGSTDNSVEICREGLKRYRLSGMVVPRPRDVIKGVASCRNLGVSKASAEWICFLDSDDLYLPEKLSKTYEIIAESKDICSAFCHAANRFDDQTGNILESSPISLKTGCHDILPSLLSRNDVITSTVTVNKGLFVELGGFDTDLMGVEDYMMWLLIARKSHWHYSAEKLCNYRVRGTSLMSGRRFQYYIGQNNSLQRAIHNSKVFSGKEENIVKNHLMGLTDYYAMESLNTYGWKDFIGGIWQLVLLEKFRMAGSLFFKHTRLSILRKLDKMYTVLLKK
jgi:glycosyltransferase involved in cell wall biosynthesis